MQITAQTNVADIAATAPATIRVFQEYQIDFCCGGKIPLAEACERHGVDAGTLLAELRAAQFTVHDPGEWGHASLVDLIAHIQKRYHAPLRAELPRLAEMLAKVVSRHGDRLAETLLPLEATFGLLQREMLEHMHKEDAVLFPAIIELEQGSEARPGGFAWIAQPINVMEAEHESAGAALARMRELTRGYAPPADACPTFRGLYYGLAELERDMHVHVHLENNILFPRAARLTREPVR